MVPQRDGLRPTLLQSDGVAEEQGHKATVPDADRRPAAVGVNREEVPDPLPSVFVGHSPVWPRRRDSRWIGDTKFGTRNPPTR